MDMEFINILAGMDKERAEKHSKKYLDLMLQHGWKKGGDKIVKLEYMRWAQEEAVKESYKRLENIVKVKDTNVRPINELTDMFENILVEDLIKFKFLFPQHAVPVVLSETFRTAEMQARELLRTWKSGKIVGTYGTDEIKETLFSLMIEMKDPQKVEKNKAYSVETLQTKFKFNYRLAELVKKFIDSPTESEALDLFTKISADSLNGTPLYGVTSTSKHLSGLAVDVSGSQNAQLLKRDLILFLHKTQKYRILIYPRDGTGPSITSLKGQLYEKKEIKPLDYLLSFISTHASTWFFHVEKG